MASFLRRKLGTGASDSGSSTQQNGSSHNGTSTNSGVSTTTTAELTAEQSRALVSTGALARSQAFRLARDAIGAGAPGVSGGLNNVVDLGLPGKPTVLTFDESQSRLAVVVSSAGGVSGGVSGGNGKQGTQQQLDVIIVFGKTSQVTISLPANVISQQIQGLQRGQSSSGGSSTAHRITFVQFVRGGRYIVAADNFSNIFVWTVASTGTGNAQPQLTYIWNVGTSRFDLDSDGDSGQTNALIYPGTYEITALCTAQTGRDIYVAYSATEYGSIPSSRKGAASNVRRVVNRNVGVSTFRLSDGVRREIFVPATGSGLTSTVPIVDIKDNPWQLRQLAITNEKGNTVIIDITMALGAYISLINTIVPRSSSSAPPSQSSGSLESKFMKAIVSHAIGNAVKSNANDDEPDDVIGKATDIYTPSILFECDLSKTLQEILDRTDKDGEGPKVRASQFPPPSLAFLSSSDLVVSFMGKMHLFSTVKSAKGLTGFIQKVRGKEHHLLSPLDILDPSKNANAGPIDALDVVKRMSSLPDYEDVVDDQSESSLEFVVYGITDKSLVQIELNSSHEHRLKMNILCKCAGRDSIRSATVIDDTIALVDMAYPAAIRFEPFPKHELISESNFNADQLVDNNIIVPATLKLASLPPIANVYMGFPPEALAWEFQKKLNSMGQYEEGANDASHTNGWHYLLNNAYHTSNIVHDREPLLVTLHPTLKLYFWKLYSNSSQFFVLDLKDDLTRESEESTGGGSTRSSRASRSGMASSLSRDSIVISDQLETICVRQAKNNYVVRIYDWIKENQISSGQNPNQYEDADVDNSFVDDLEEDEFEYRDLTRPSTGKAQDTNRSRCEDDDEDEDEEDDNEGNNEDLFAELDNVVDQVLATSRTDKYSIDESETNNRLDIEEHGGPSHSQTELPPYTSGVSSATHPPIPPRKENSTTRRALPTPPTGNSASKPQLPSRNNLLARQEEAERQRCSSTENSSGSKSQILKSNIKDFAKNVSEKAKNIQLPAALTKDGSGSRGSSSSSISSKNTPQSLDEMRNELFAPVPGSSSNDSGSTPTGSSRGKRREVISVAQPKTEEELHDMRNELFASAPPLPEQPVVTHASTTPSIPTTQRPRTAEIQSTSMVNAPVAKKGLIFGNAFINGINWDRIDSHKKDKRDTNSGGFKPTLEIVLVPTPDTDGRFESIEPTSPKKSPFEGGVHIMDVRAGRVAILWGKPRVDGSDGLVITLATFGSGGSTKSKSPSISLPLDLRAHDVAQIRIVNSFLCDITTHEKFGQLGSSDRPRPRTVVCVLTHSGTMLTVCEPLNGSNLEHGCTYLPPSRGMPAGLLRPIDVIAYPAPNQTDSDVIVVIYNGGFSAFTVRSDQKNSIPGGMNTNNSSTVLNQFATVNESRNGRNVNYVSDTCWYNLITPNGSSSKGSSSANGPVFVGGGEVISCKRLDQETFIVSTEFDVQTWRINPSKNDGQGHQRPSPPSFTLVWYQRASVLGSCMQVMNSLGGWLVLRTSSSTFSRFLVQVDRETYSKEKQLYQQGQWGDKVVGKIKTSVSTIQNGGTSSRDIASLEQAEFLATIRNVQPLAGSANRSTGSGINSDVESQRNEHGRLISGMNERGEKLSQLQEATSTLASKSKGFAERARLLNKR